jgi:hypothetical protein
MVSIWKHSGVRGICAVIVKSIEHRQQLQNLARTVDPVLAAGNIFRMPTGLLGSQPIGARPALRYRQGNLPRFL